MFSITMYDSETRVYLDPPIKNVSELQLLDCNIKTKRLITLNNQEKITDEQGGPLVILNPGTYSLNDIKILIEHSEKGKNITMIIGDNFGYIINNKSFNLLFTQGLQNSLGVPKVLFKISQIDITIKEPLRLLCSIVDNRMSYSNKGKNGGLVKIQPSQLLANIPSKDYPSIPIRKYDNFINHFDLTILDSDWKRFYLKGESVTFSLRFK